MSQKMVKDWMETWERNTAKWMEEVTKSQHFIRNFMATYEPLMSVTKNTQVAREKWFETFGVASKEDSNRISQKTTDIEIRISDILEKVEMLSDEHREIMKALEKVAKGQKAPAPKAPVAKKAPAPKKKTTTRKKK